MKKVYFFIGLIIALYSNPTYAQHVIHIAGNNITGYSGDGGQATNASFQYTYGICQDLSGNLYIGDGDRVRVINSTTGIITTVAGGTGLDTTDNIPATSASITGAYGLCITAQDGVNYLYIADGRNKVRKVNLATGIITTAAGRGPGGYGGDGGQATAALLSQPHDVAIDREGNLYISEYFNNTIRKVNATTGIISTIAGIAMSGSGSYGGDGGPATAAFFDRPQGVSLDSHENIFITDQYNNRVRRIDAVTGIITTVIGIGPTGIGGYSGDGGSATAASVNLPYQAIFDKNDNVYISDVNNLRIRKVESATGIISTYAGCGMAPGSVDTAGDGGLAAMAKVAPICMCIDSCGNLYFDDGSMNVRAVTASGPSLAVCGLASLGVQAGKLTMKELMVSPNPTSGNITIQSPEAGSFVVYNMVGQQVAAHKVASGATDVRLPAALAAGVYMGAYKADDGGAQQMVRVVVAR